MSVRWLSCGVIVALVGFCCVAPARGDDDSPEALTSDSVGWWGPDRSLGLAAPRAASLSPAYSLSVDGDVALGGSVFKSGYSFLHSVGGTTAGNTGLGFGALSNVTPGAAGYASGYWNVAVGAQALQYVTTGYSNTALGRQALWKNSQGQKNTAVGALALLFNTLGSQNTAVGVSSLALNWGSNNTGIGFNALSNSSDYNSVNNTAVGAFALDASTGPNNTAMGEGALGSTTTGGYNIALGAGAGGANSTGSSSIWIGSPGASESNTLRIGNGTGTMVGKLNRVFISGIANAPGTGFDQVVCVKTTTDQLGPCPIIPSSRRFKDEIVDMGEASAGIFGLRPVTFRYKDAAAYGPLSQYGLIAEEVAEVFPQLVVYDAEGLPLTVRYEALTPLLLNELARLRAEVSELESRLAAAARMPPTDEPPVADLRATHAAMRRLEARLDRLEADRAAAPERARHSSSTRARRAGT